MKHARHWVFVSGCFTVMAVAGAAWAQENMGTLPPLPALPPPPVAGGTPQPPVMPPMPEFPPMPDETPMPLLTPVVSVTPAQKVEAFPAGQSPAHDDAVLFFEEDSIEAPSPDKTAAGNPMTKQKPERETLEDFGKEPEKKVDWRSNVNFRSERLPETVYKKEYGRENNHLPAAIYEDEMDGLMFQAIGSGNVNALQALLDEGRNKEARNSAGDTPLLHAARTGNIEAARVLLAEGVMVNVTDAQEFIPLHYAAYLGSTDLIAALLAKKAPIDAMGQKGITPLMLAAARGHADAVTLLLSKGADPAVRNASGFTAYDLAARSGKKLVVEALASGASRTQR